MYKGTALAGPKMVKIKRGVKEAAGTVLIDDFCGSCWYSRG